MKNKACWPDENGQPIQAHGGCLLHHEGLWYWYGEDKSGGTEYDPATGYHVPFTGFRCYTSKDLLHWHDAGLALAPGGALPPASVGERPSILHNEKTGQFVMWFHYDDRRYLEAKAGCAVSKSPTGPFAFLEALRPNGRESRDLSLFKDRDGTACLLNSTDGNSTLMISQLNDAYTGLTGTFTLAFPGQYREAPVLIESGGLYLLFTSGCSGWAPNPMLYATSGQVLGSWVLWNNPCSGPASATSYRGQPACAFENEGNWYLLLDHWNREDLGRSGYSILPIHTTGREVSVPFLPEWNGLIQA